MGVIRAVAAEAGVIRVEAGEEVDILQAAGEVVRREAVEHHMQPRHIPRLALRPAAAAAVAVRREVGEQHMLPRPGRRIMLRLAEEQLMFREGLDTLRRSVAHRRSLIRISPPGPRRARVGHMSPHIRRRASVRRRAFTRDRQSARDRRGALRQEPNISVAGTDSVVARPVRSRIPG